MLVNVFLLYSYRKYLSKNSPPSSTFFFRNLQSNPAPNLYFIISQENSWQTWYEFISPNLMFNLQSNRPWSSIPTNSPPSPAKKYSPPHGEGNTKLAFNSSQLLMSKLLYPYTSIIFSVKNNLSFLLTESNISIYYCFVLSDYGLSPPQPVQWCPCAAPVWQLYCQRGVLWGSCFSPRSFGTTLQKQWAPATALYYRVRTSWPYHC